MGVVVHLENVGTLYQTHLTDYIEPALIASGLRHVRDGGLASTLNDYGMTQIYVNTYNQVASLVQQHTGHRLGFDLILAPLNGGSSNGSNSCDWLTRSPVSTLLKYLNIEYVDGFEGMNEYDWEYPQFTPNCVTSSTWAGEDAAFQQAIYSDIKSNPQTSSLPVVGPSFGTSAGMAAMGNVSQYEDFGTQHSYPFGSYPSANIASNEARLSHINGSKPYVATETGYYTTPDGQTGISEEAYGKYMSRLFFEYFNAGILRTYAYELIDDPTQPGPFAHFGLLRSDGSSKPGFTAIANEIAILQDPGPPIKPGSLTYSLGGIPSTLHHTLLQKRNGSFDLVLWQEVPSYNLTHELDINPLPLSVQLTLCCQAASVTFYDPVHGSSPVASITNVKEVTVPVPDRAVIVEIKP